MALTDAAGDVDTKWDYDVFGAEAANAAISTAVSELGLSQIVAEELRAVEADVGAEMELIIGSESLRPYEMTIRVSGTNYDGIFTYECDYNTAVSISLPEE
jgi:hypothetical protein